MEPIPQNVVTKLKLKEAAERVAVEWRNYLPPEPWQQSMKSSPGEFAKLVSTRLKAGHPNSAGVAVYARKSSFAHRPIPILGPLERVALEALTTHLLADLSDEDRDPAAYTRFVSGPIEAASAGQIFFTPANSAVTHVAQSDVSAYYEYIDHAVLRSELDLQTDMLGESQWVADLLGEVQGRGFGLPQMLSCSDRLADVHADALRRDLLRQGYRVWRYNDDFRVATGSFSEALGAIEALNESAHRIGLTLNGQKTTVYKFSTYFWRHWIEDEHEGDVEFKPEDVEVSSDYGELDEDGLASVADATLARFSDTDPKFFNFDHLTNEDVADIRRMFSIFGKLEREDALSVVSAVFSFVPQMSHRAGRYMADLHNAGISVEPAWKKVAEDSKELNAWQHAWLAYVGRVCDVFENATNRDWLTATYDGERSGLLHAELSLAMAPYGLIEFEKLDRQVRLQPDSMSAWYVMAADQVPGVNTSQRDALRKSSQLFTLLMAEP